MATGFNNGAIVVDDAATTRTNLGAAPAAGSSSITTVGTISSGTWNGTVIDGAYGGTGVNNSTHTITYGGNVTFSGAFTTTITVTGTTSITFPTSGTLCPDTGSANIATVGTLTSGTWNATVIAGQYGGTGVNNSGKTITLAANFTTSGANALTLTTTGVTNVTLPTTGTLCADTGSANIATVGTITSGTWHGGIITGTYGGTGVNNGANTITLGGNISTAAAFTTSGANALTLTTTGSTNVTLPTSGTLATTTKGTFTVNASGAYTVSNITFNYTLCGDIVVLSAGMNTLITGTISASQINFTAIPSNLRPARTTDILVRAVDNNVVLNPPGLIRINTDGTMNGWKDLFGDNFTAGSTTAGFSNLSMTYTVN